MYKPAVIAGALVVAGQAPAAADGLRAQPDAGWRAWSLDPLVLLCLGTTAWFYGRGLARLWSRVGVGAKLRGWQAACFVAGLIIVGLALLSPIDAWSEELASVHMIQHLLLVTLAAPLMVAGAPLPVIAGGLTAANKGWGKSLFVFLLRLPQEPLLWQPVAVWALFAAALWAWHHPVLYQAALRDPLLHDAQHLSFFVTAGLFWRVCLDPLSRRRLSPLAAVPYLFTTALQSTALGVFLALSPRVWYPDYAARTTAFGLSPLEDQQVAGLIMWVPGCVVYPAVAALLFGAALAGGQGDARGRSALRPATEEDWR
jgi:cytochrome c oxidase assembly factor CtaG